MRSPADHAQTASASIDRLPSISASQALQDLKFSPHRYVSSGLPYLDALLAGRNDVSSEAGKFVGGLVRGQLTEVYGPPGVGKSALGMQAAANALAAGQRATWIDCGARFSTSRFDSILHGVASSSGLASQEANRRSCFQHLTSPTLAHLIALLLHPPASFPLKGTALLVIDTISTLIESSYPRHSEFADSKAGTPTPSAPASRRHPVTADLAGALTKLAGLHNIAVLLTSHSSTKVRTVSGTRTAFLGPAITGAAWDSAVATRLVVFRDWTSGSAVSSQSNMNADDGVGMARFVGVMRVNGKDETRNGWSEEEHGSAGTKIVPFGIVNTGLIPLTIIPPSQSSQPNHAAQPRTISLPFSPSKSKRKFAAIDGEVPDSDAESGGEVAADDYSDEYGWDVEYELAATEGLVDEGGAMMAQPLPSSSQGPEPSAKGSSPAPLRDPDGEKEETTQ